MNFDWDETQIGLHKAATDFAKRWSTQRTPSDTADDGIRQCGEAGLTGMCVPEQFGGSGFDALTTAYVMEGFGAGLQEDGLILALGAHLFASTMPVAERGSAEQKQHFLPRLASGDWIGANAISEANAGSDLAQMETRAVREADTYYITGSKSYVTNAPFANLFLVYASTAPAHGYLGISAFIVPRDSEGLSVGKPFEKIGLRDAHTAPIYLDRCPVPVDRRLGDEGEGLAIFNRSMAWERTCMFAGFLGAHARRLREAFEYTRVRKQFRRPICRYPAVAHRLLDCAMRLERARLLLYKACEGMAVGEASARDVAMAKLAISESAVQAGLASIRSHGGLGVVMESGVPWGLLDALPTLIFSGTSELQRETVYGSTSS